MTLSKVKAAQPEALVVAAMLARQNIHVLIHDVRVN